MDRLPWHLQMQVWKRMDLDTLRALGVAPGKLRVPAPLRDALHRSLAMRTHGSSVSVLELPIPNTLKLYKLVRGGREMDTDLEHTVVLQEVIDTPNGYAVRLSHSFLLVGDAVHRWQVRIHEITGGWRSE